MQNDIELGNRAPLSDVIIIAVAKLIDDAQSDRPRYGLTRSRRWPLRKCGR